MGVWGWCFLLNFVGPFFIHCLGVSYGELGSSSPTEPAFFSSVLMGHPPPNSDQISIPNPDTSCSHEPDVCLQLSLCIAFKSNAMFLSLLLNSVNTIWNKTKSRKYKQIAKQIAVYGRYYAKYFIWFVFIFSQSYELVTVIKYSWFRIKAQIKMKFLGAPHEE